MRDECARGHPRVHQRFCAFVGARGDARSCGEELASFLGEGLGGRGGVEVVAGVEGMNLIVPYYSRNIENE